MSSSFFSYAYGYKYDYECASRTLHTTIFFTFFPGCYYFYNFNYTCNLYSHMDLVLPALHAPATRVSSSASVCMRVIFSIVSEVEERCFSSSRNYTESEAATSPLILSLSVSTASHSHTRMENLYGVRVCVNK